MINHTMIVSFSEPIPDAELNQFLSGMKKLMLDSGHVRSAAAHRHIPFPGDEHGPVFRASAIVRFEFTDLDALNASFAIPDVGAFIKHWQSRYPYQVVWANHEEQA
ncbi:hypothetical protein [Sciscionella sediminilitoris]|uniref:hypothetical protein n=1 Tax=Sciscionella sediminilitoris TaxID=1445613 RepID=UPI0004DF2CF6|nr:hypothetical protein [Sciscionella sp. SE31]